jgi:hypothetical protein
MRRALLLLWIAPLAAQQPESPAPPVERWLTGYADFGYRWLAGQNGNLSEYRSVINLGEGPKLFGIDFTIQDPNKRLFDRIGVRAYGWGGDPYNTAHVDASKAGQYTFHFDYRNIAYFNAVPSFANPASPAGFDQQTFDIRRRSTSANLDLRPGKRWVPYLAFDRNAGHGRGIDTWVLGSSDSFAVPVFLRDGVNHYRGGIRFTARRFDATLGQGGTTFKGDDQSYFSGVNPGSRTTPDFGQTLALYGLAQAYGIRGTSVYSRGLFSAHPTAWIDLYGQFLFSQPKTNTNYADLAYGNFISSSGLLFLSSQQTVGNVAAIQPHSTGSAGFELRPVRGLRIVESWMTDRFHDAPGRFVNYSQQQTDVFFDLTSRLTLRAGYRRVWGDSKVLASPLSQTGSLLAGELNRSIGLAGLTFRASKKLSMNLDYEGASSDQIYFRTSLNNYHRARARARYQVGASLSLQANFQVLNNQNPATDVRYDFQSRRNAIAAFWTPNGGKRITVTAEYDRSTVRSDIRYLGLFLAPALSSYRDNAHVATSAVDVAAGRCKLTLGGSMFIGSGSRPTRYYEPLARVAWPLHPHIAWNAEWRWYGFGEEFYKFEGFRTHLFITGLRITR